jgi:hypothetical protein
MKVSICESRLNDKNLPQELNHTTQPLVHQHKKRDHNIEEIFNGSL